MQDVVIVGAGLSGIGAACHLLRSDPTLDITVLERRDAIGGTWDLFRYPGIRSDSDMYSFGYNFRPWTGTSVLSDGTSIREYIAATAEEYGVVDRIRFGRRVVSAEWSSPDAAWTVTATDEATGESETSRARHLVLATGYYDYDRGHRPDFPGEERFTGQIVHPQHWPQDLDVADRDIVVIGSGATAVTLVPALAGDGARVTMLQRSPTYIVPLPSHDPVAPLLERVHVPSDLAHRIGRLRNIVIQRATYDLSRHAPAVVKSALRRVVRRAVGPDVDLRHFTPSYNPWDERLCVVPDADLFREVRSGRARIVTDRIDTFTERGIRTESGEEIPADVIVTATGLRLQLGGGMTITVDGVRVDPHDRVLYRGVLLDGVPNALFVIGYTNASWTLKADLASQYYTRLLGEMRRRGATRAVARAEASDRSDVSIMAAALKSGYIQRGETVMPRQGTRRPFKAPDNYLLDLVDLRHRPVVDDSLVLDDPRESADRTDERTTITAP